LNPFHTDQILLDQFGNRFLVLGVAGHLVWTSCGDDFTEPWFEPMRWQDMGGYTIEDKQMSLIKE